MWHDLLSQCLGELCAEFLIALVQCSTDLGCHETSQLQGIVVLCAAPSRLQTRY